MWRIIFYLVGVVGAAFLCISIIELHGTASLAVEHGTMSLTLGSRADGTVYEISLGVLLAALPIAALVVYLAYRLLKFLLFLPVSAFSLSRSRRRAKGQAAIARGLVAAASGDLVAAARHAQAADRLVGHEPLALLLKAQAAQLHGDRAAAKDAFSRMTRLTETRGLGLRGLFVEARRRGDGVEASRHAAHATELDVFLPWAHEATLLAQCRARDWQAALVTLERNYRLGAMAAGEMRRAKAALLTARALDLKRAEPREALLAASKALSIDPGLTPAATAAASLLAHDGRQRKAVRIIEAAWRIAPHPDLAEAYLGLHPNASAAERLKQMTKLAALKPDNEESRVALGQSLLAAREFDEARAALLPLWSARPTARVCLLMAEIEEAEHGMTGPAREWLARAAHAPRDPVWISDGTISPQWTPVEAESGRIGTFAWEHPPEIVSAPPPSSRLPAVVPPAIREMPPVVATALPATPAPAPDIAAIEVKSERVPAAMGVGTSPPQGETGVDRPPPKAVPNGVDASRTRVEQASPAVAAGDVIQAPAPQPAKIKGVSFPLERAPDDPGTERPRRKGFWQRPTE